ncbi:MAG: hypothetical protein IPK48_07960 [Gammaproteobacteria bacterium]|nr:hypothetical protein [Gammaproteobacteria bacterium]
MSVQRLLAQANNAVPAATVAASSVLPAARQVFQQATVRAGNGVVALSGSYSGAADATIDVEIRTPSTGAELATTPVFAGAGNGTLTDLSIDGGTAAQDVTVTLVDVGTETSAAQLTIYGDILLRAKTAGAAGNALVLTVAPSLTLSASPVGALSVALDKDAQDWTDQRAYFGAVPLLPDGTIPATAPRLVFGGDLSRVYRHYKRWDGEGWRYGVSPKLATAYPAGSTVNTVTGTYSVEIDDGVTPETYASVATLYDFLTALSASALVEVVGAIGNNKKPGGIAGIDLPIRTGAFSLPIMASAPDRMPELIEVNVAASSPTETISIECTKNSPVGGERWAVRSKAAGTALADAITGALYTDSDSVQFRIPVIPRTASPVSGVMAITARSFPRGADAATGVPAICLDRPKLGASASGKSLRLVWTARPPEDCNCKDAAVAGGPSATCLGIDIEGDTAMGTLVAGYQTRLETLYTWRADFIAANTDLSSANGMLTTVYQDVDLANQVTRIFAECLAELYADSDTPDSGALSLWDADLSVMDTALSQLEAIEAEPSSGVTRWTIGTSYSSGDDILPPLERKNGHSYRISPQPIQFDIPDTTTVGEYYAVSSFTPTADVETWPTNGGSVSIAGIGTFTAGSDSHTRAGVAILQDLGPYGDADNVTTADPATLRRAVEQFVQRYSAAMDLVRATGGLVPKSNASGGDGCWRDPGDSFWWVIEGTAYLPVFNNVYYHSTVLAANDAGELVPVSTHEFGFGLQVACAERLQEGDSITITIGDVAADYPYQIGDNYQIPIIGGGPLEFTGGVDGTDTLTWAVQGSVDGALDDYELDLDEDPYADGGLNFTIHRGGIPFALDDVFSFSVEAGGRFRWRKDVGSWSSDTAIAASVSLTDGLSALFQSGAAPSFVYGDTYSYTVRQPNAPDHTQSAHGEEWKWSGTGATLTATWASDQTVSVVGLLRHGLTSPATVSIALKNSGGTTLATIAPTVAAGPILTALTSPLTTVRSMVVTVASAIGMSLGWVYAGVPFVAPYDAKMTWRRSYAMDRPNGINPRAAYLGAGRAGELAWEDFLSQEAADTLLAMIDDCKADGDAPIVIVPQILFPQDAILARIDTDAVDLSDWYEFQPDDRTRRALSLTLPLAAVLS